MVRALIEVVTGRGPKSLYDRPSMPEFFSVKVADVAEKIFHFGFQPYNECFV